MMGSSVQLPWLTVLKQAPAYSKYVITHSLMKQICKGVLKVRQAKESLA